MKQSTSIGVVAVAVMLSFGTLTYAAVPQAGKQRLDNVPAGGSPFADPRAVTKEKQVQGELVKIEGEFYVVKNAAGKEVRMHVDKNTAKLDKYRTKMDRYFKVGDKIEAQLTPFGHAVLVQMAMAPPAVVGKGPDAEELARRNLEEQQRFQSQRRDSPGLYIYPRDFSPEIGGQQQAGPDDFPQPAFPLVTGELMNIEGEFYTVQDVEGKQVRLHVDNNTKLDCGPDLKGTCSFSIGDKIEVRRIAPTNDYASAIRQLSLAEIAALAKPVSPVGAGTSAARVKPGQILGGARQAVRGEILKVDGEWYAIMDHHGNKVRFVVNQNTRMDCGPGAGSWSDLLPDPAASDKPGVIGQPQYLSRTAEQKGTQVGPGTKAGAGSTTAACMFKTGDEIEAEISDLGRATFIQMAGREQPGQPLP